MDYMTIRKMLEDKIDEIGKKGELTTSYLECLDKSLSALKNTYKVEMFEGGDYSSEAGMWDRQSAYRGGDSYRSYDDGGSYRRGSRRSYDGGSYRGYSSHGTADRLRQMMENAKSDAERDALRRAISEIE